VFVKAARCHCIQEGDWMADRSLQDAWLRSPAEYVLRGLSFSEARIGGRTRDGIEQVGICVILALVPGTGIRGIKNKVRTHHIVHNN
jgi:hypothetical protein